MTILKRIAVILFVLSLIINVNVVYAEARPTGEGRTTIIYEYDYYVRVRKMTIYEAIKIYKISAQDYIEICNIENILVELAKMSADDLTNRGMNEKQIATLKSYDGSRLEDNQQLRAVLATLTISYANISSSSSAVKVRMDWSWNSKPLITAVDICETGALRWKAYNSYNSQIMATYSSSGSDCFVTYYYGNVAQTTQWKPISIGNSISYVFSQFASAIKDGNKSCWAKTGYMIVKVTGSNISKVDFGLGYNHGISSTPTTITLDGNLGFIYSNGYEMSEVSFTINV